MLKAFSFNDYDLTDTQREILKESIKNKKNILITGNSQSGKTSFLNVCLDELNNKDLRVVTITDKDELVCPVLNTTKGLINSEYSAVFLIQAYLKMKPDYIILDEIRGTNDFFEILKAWNTGHSGIAVYPITDLVKILYSYSRMDFEHDIFQILISNTLDIVIEVEDKKVKEIQEITEYDSELKKGNYKKII